MEEQLLPVVQRAYDLNKWLLPRVERFSRRYKFSLGDRIQSAALDLCLALVEAGHSQSKDRPLHRASRLLDQLRLLLRLAADVGELSARQLEFVSGIHEEIGRMIGGWLKAARADLKGRQGSLLP
ncbi:MAG: diversity-generating retroelement protein Avd [Acidobacteria bacterium]|nr:diversity-generating retroelement protein Avd [Acidobacteriota bacterium]